MSPTLRLGHRFAIRRDGTKFAGLGSHVASNQAATDSRSGSSTLVGRADVSRSSNEEVCCAALGWPGGELESGA